MEVLVEAYHDGESASETAIGRVFGLDGCALLCNVYRTAVYFFGFDNDGIVATEYGFDGILLIFLLYGFDGTGLFAE